VGPGCFDQMSNLHHTDMLRLSGKFQLGGAHYVDKIELVYRREKLYKNKTPDSSWGKTSVHQIGCVQLDC
jgi:hypothetical protein